MTTLTEPFNIPDYAHDPNDTLAIVPNGDAPPLMRLEDAYAARIAELERERDKLVSDADDYSRLLGDLQRERMLREAAQTERDRATRKAKLYENLVVELALEILSLAHGEMSQDSLVQHAREILGDDEPATTATE